MTDIHDQGRSPGKDVHNGDDGRNEAQPRRRRSFTPEFKSEVVALVRQPGRTVGSVARELDLTETAVREWVKQAERDEGVRPTG